MVITHTADIFIAKRGIFSLFKNTFFFPAGRNFLKQTFHTRQELKTMAFSVREHSW